MGRYGSQCSLTLALLFTFGRALLYFGVFGIGRRYIKYVTVKRWRTSTFCERGEVRERICRISEPDSLPVAWANLDIDLMTSHGLIRGVDVQYKETVE